MIKVIYMINDKKPKPYFAMRIKGHAQSDEKGRDLVCCAVSTLIGTLHGFLECTEEDFRVEINSEGQIAMIKGKGAWAVHAALQTLTGLQMLAESYPDYVEVVQIKKGVLF